MRGSTIHGRASFKRTGLILSCPMDLLLSIIEMYLPTSRTERDRQTERSRERERETLMVYCLKIALSRKGDKVNEF